MKVRSFFNINHNGNNKKTNFKVYQSLVKKLINLVCGTKSDIWFIVCQLKRHNSHLKADNI